jgi:phage recombination protein Bet
MSKPDQTTQTEQPPAATKQRSIIEFTPFGAKEKIQLSIEIVKRLIAVKTKSGKTCSDEDAFKFMLMCQARHLNPFEGDAYLIGYDSQGGASFSLITAHQAFLKRAELNPEFDGMESGTIVLREAKLVDLIGDWHMPSDKIMGGWATIYFKNRKHAMTKRVRLERFNSGFGIWRTDPAGMIVKCAEADALRSSFPTMLGGMFTHEEMNVSTTAEIAKPVFNGGAEELPPAATTVVESEPTQPARATEPATTSEPKKKPTLQRRTRSTERAPDQSPEIATPQHDKLKELLTAGGCSTDDFVSLALDEGWIEPEHGTWDKISEDQIAKFLQPDNWSLVMELLDERRAMAAKATKTTTPAPRSGELL